jgi:hypothetical protein
MSNPIKYSTGTESLALKKGNFYIGTGDVGKGPTSTTGYYNGISPPTGGYTIYLNKETGGPSIYTVSNDTQLISLTNSIAGQSYTTVNECLVYFAGQTDKLCVNRVYEGIVTNGLILSLDAGFTPSYPKNQTTSYDLSGSNYDLTLVNGMTYSSDNGGTFTFDGTNDGGYGPITNDSNINTEITMEAWYYRTGGNGDRGLILNKENCYEIGINNSNGEFQWAIASQAQPWAWLGGSSNITNTWVHGVVTRDSNSLEISYINGVPQSTVQRTSSPILKLNNRINIGGRGGSTSPASNFGGKIPIGRFYNSALSADEVVQNYNAQKGRFGL